MFTYHTLLISYVYTVLYTVHSILPMPHGHCSSIYLYVHILIHPFTRVCVSVCEVVVKLLDITALSELEAQAFRYTRI